MTLQEAQSTIPLQHRPPRDIQDWLELLRDSVSRLNCPHNLDRVVWGLSEAADCIANEHAGMADELLCVYEQLGIVFEVTRKLSMVRNEAEVVELFLDCLRRSFSKRTVWAVRARAGTGWVASSDVTAAPMEPWLVEHVERSREGGKVLVEFAPDSSKSPIAQCMVGPVFAGDEFICAIVTTRSANVREFRASDMSLLESLTVFCGDLIRVHRLLDEMREMSVTMVRSLVSAVDQKDEYTSGHSVRVGYFATMFGKKLGLPEEELRMLQWSAFLHDVGKIGIRDDVLKKPGKLTFEEFEHIKEHPVRSHQVVQEVPQLVNALDGVLYHHEHYDGSGYPKGLVGEAIPLQARIIQIADIFDALTTTRSYRGAHDWGRALEILKEESAKTVDPKLAEIFIKMIRDMLGQNPAAWERLIQRATQFTRLSDLTEADFRV